MSFRDLISDPSEVWQDPTVTTVNQIFGACTPEEEALKSCFNDPMFSSSPSLNGVSTQSLQLPTNNTDNFEMNLMQATGEPNLPEDLQEISLSALSLDFPLEQHSMEMCLQNKTPLLNIPMVSCINIFMN